MNSITVTRNILEVLQEVVLTYIVFITLNYIYIHREMGFGVVVVIFLQYCAMHYFRAIARNKKSIAAVGIMLGLIMLVVPFSPTIRMLLIISCFFQIVFGWRFLDQNKRLGKAKDKIFVYLLLGGLSFVYCMVMKSDIFLTKLTIAILLLTLFVVIQHYFDGMADYIECSKECTGLSTKSMIGANTMTILMVSVFLVLFIAICNYFNILENFFGGIVYLIRYLLGRINLDYSQGYWEVEIEDEPMEFKIDNTINENGIYYVLAALTIVAVCVSAYGIVEIIKAFSGKKSSSEDIVEKLKLNDEKIIKIKKEKKESRIFLNPVQKIRKYYRKKVLQYQYDVSLDTFKSCNEIKDEIQEQKEESIKELSELYEQVRYGRGEVSDEIVKKAKKYAAKR